LKTRTKQHDIARIFHSHTTASNAVLSNSLKASLANRIVKIQQKERQERLMRAAGRPYASLIVGSVGGGLESEGYGNSRAGSDFGEGYGYEEEDELRGDEFLDGHGHARSGTLAVPGSGRRGAGGGGWDGSTAPSADEADTPFVAAAAAGGRRDGRRRKALLDPDEGDNDSVAGADGPSTSGTPKRNKRRKVEVPKGGAGGGAGGLGKGGAAGGVAKGSRKGARRSNRGRMIGGGIVGLEDWSVPYPDLGAPPPVLLPSELDANGAGLPISFIPRTENDKPDSTTLTTTPVTEQAYDAAFTPIWASIVSTGVPYAFKARANHVASVKMVHERVAKWCAVAAKRGWGGEYSPPVPLRLTGKEKDAAAIALGAGGRFGRDAQAKTKKLQRELLTFWKKNEKEEREERRRREKERVEKARAELEKKEEQRQRRKLEFLITQTELYSHFVGKRLQSGFFFYSSFVLGLMLMLLV
jgi:DNA-binding domain